MNDHPVSTDQEAVAAYFDPDFYAAAYPDVVARVGANADDLLTHFCTEGWRELRRPSADFDVWWYWVSHLDPGSEDVNPLVHYARTGRAAGLSTRPVVQPVVRSGTAPTDALPTDRPVRRACLFAAFDADGLVDDAMKLYVRELARFADVFVLFDNYVSPAELAELDGIAQGAWAVRHGAYDFGSYATLARELVGWDRLADYDEVLFVNDSCYLLRPLDEVFAKMAQTPCDWWGLQATKGLAMTRDNPVNHFDEPIPLDVVRRDLLATYEDDVVYDFHIGSYFMAFRRPVLEDPVFRKLVDSITKQTSKRAIVQKYEIGLTHVLIGRGHPFSTYVPALYPFHPMFTEWAFTLIEAGLPLLKRFLLYHNHYDTPGLARWKERVLAVVPDAPVVTFEENLLRTAPADSLQRSFALGAPPAGESAGSADAGATVVALSGRRFVKQDRRTKKRADWWVFPVDRLTHTLPESSRAVFDQVADDPEVTKIVLTRSRRLQLAGRKVVTEPVASAAGRERLTKAGTVFVADLPAKTLGVRVPPTLHHLVAVRRGGLQLLKHGRTAGAPRAPRSEPPPVSGPLEMLHTPASPQLTAVLTASDVDQLAEVASHWPARYDTGWRTGIPLHDYLHAELATEQLPADLREQEAQLRRLLGGRRLVLFTSVLRRSDSELAPYRFEPAEVDHLRRWAREHDCVIGIRESLFDLERAYSVAFGQAMGAEVLDVSARRFPATAIVLRQAAALLTDYDGAALDFTLTGRPVVSFAHDLDAMTDRLLYDLDHVFPGPVCRNFDALAATLATLFDEPTPTTARQYARVRDLLIDRADGGSAARVVARVQELAPADRS